MLYLHTVYPITELNTMDALELALLNATQNSHRNGETSFVSPQDQYEEEATLSVEKDAQEQYEKEMRKLYSQQFFQPSRPVNPLVNLEQNTTPPQIQGREDIIYSYLTSFGTQVADMSQAIKQLKDDKVESNHKHRSLSKWGDDDILNELIERENNLMPFYYELLKRVPHPELLNMINQSLESKIFSMRVLAQICSSIGQANISNNQPDRL
jgi:hypothetical protein